MHRDDPEAADRLDRALDALDGGGAPPTEPWLDATDLRLRTLDTAFAPTEGVLMGIWGSLTSETTTVAATGVAMNGSVGPGGHRPFWAPGPPLRSDTGHWWWPRGWSVGAVSTVALVFLVVAAGYAAIRLAGLGDNDGEGGPVGIAIASPSPDELIVPPPSECTVEPRPMSFFEQFVATPNGSGQHGFPIDDADSIAPEDLTALGVETRNGEVVLLGGSAADGDVIPAVSSTVREFQACGNAGDGTRLNALLSDDFLRRLITAGGGLAEDSLTREIPSPIPKPADNWGGHFPIQNARLLDNGHVAAILSFVEERPTGESELDAILLTFVNIGDRWLIDGMAPASEIVAQPTGGERIVPSPDECTVEPLTWQEIESVAATPPADTSIPFSSSAMDPVLRRQLNLRREAGLLKITGGDPADQTTIAEVQDVLNTYFACLNARDLARMYALFSEEIFGILGTVSGEDEASFRAVLEASPTPGPREQWIGYYPVTSARVLSTEHVVLLQPVDVSMFSAFDDDSIAYDPDLAADPYLLVSFIKDGDRWRIDSYQIQDANELLEQPSLIPNAAPEAAVTPMPDRPTHRSNSHNAVNLRSGPGIDTRIVTTLTIAQPLHYLDEDAPTDDPARDGPRWMKFRTEDGWIGWVREIDVEPIDAPTPTPVG